MAIPIDSSLYEQVKRLADSKFKVHSAYKSAWIVREYKARGGRYEGNKKIEGLNRWFMEKWVDLSKPTNNGFEKCGVRGKDYPTCRPSVRIDSNTPKTVNELTKKQINSVVKKKQVVKGKGRVVF